MNGSCKESDRVLRHLKLGLLCPIWLDEFDFLLLVGILKLISLELLNGSDELLICMKMVCKQENQTNLSYLLLSTGVGLFPKTEINNPFFLSYKSYRHLF